MHFFNNTDDQNFFKKQLCVMSALLSYECAIYVVSTTSPIAVKRFRLFVQVINYEKHRIEKK